MLQYDGRANGPRHRTGVLQDTTSDTDLYRRINRCPFILNTQSQDSTLVLTRPTLTATRYLRRYQAVETRRHMMTLNNGMLLLRMSRLYPSVGNGRSRNRKGCND